MSAKSPSLLKEYRAKRDFSKTAEPSGSGKARTGKTLGSFVVQKHDATRLHYDFRLELDGVLKSWAVTKGPSTNPADKRLAVRVEDHPLDYGSFEGTIPKGEYGGGTVALWDRGTWEPIGNPHEGLETGDLKFRLFGERMQGEWVLVHMKSRDTKRRSGPARENWLLIKHHDDFATEGGKLLTEKFGNSVSSARTLDEIAKGTAPKAKPRAKVVKTATAKPKSKVWTGGKALTLPDFRAPQLATLVDSVPEGDGWIFEMKYDGYRAIAALAGPEVRLFTRNGNDWSAQFGPMVEPLAKLTKGTAMLDGEICALNKAGRTDFSMLKDALSDGGTLVYFVFDLLEEDGQDLSDLPLTERKARLKKLLGRLPRHGAIQYSDHIEGDGKKVFEGICKAGHEGIIAKKADAPYRHERSKTWLKIKCGHRQEFIIGGWQPSEKKKTFASLLLGTLEDGKLIYRGRVGTGFTVDGAEALQTKLKAHARKTNPFANAPRLVARSAQWVTPQLVAEIAFTEFTPDGYLRHPSFQGLREDKPASAVKLEEAPLPAQSRKSPSGRKRNTAMPADMTLTDEMGLAAAERAGIKLTHPDRAVYPGDTAKAEVTKAELCAYYEAVAERMLPFIADRPLSLLRQPHGQRPFFQKHNTGGFSAAMKTVAIAEKDGDKADYFYIDSLSGLIGGVQMNVLEWHLWGAKRSKIEKPERIIFDIDPDEGLGFDAVRRAAFTIRDELAAHNLKSFAMVTGGKGVHVIAPLAPKGDWALIKTFCQTFAQRLAEREPERFTANLSKAKRKGRMFIDYLRNERGSTAVAPWSTRARTGGPVAMPVGWDELDTITAANVFLIEAAAARAKLPDPWPDYFALTQSITKAMLTAVTDDKI